MTKLLISKNLIIYNEYSGGKRNTANGTLWTDAN
ncbi:MAG: hypothetical protein PWQ17_1797 [Anaerophaga sp.]|nr:hypothetical protein [Anaerophaga sp.]